MPRALRRSSARRSASPQALALRLDRAEGALPLYRQIRDGVRDAVLGGVLAPGTRMPPERELAEALAVNRSTVMHAYQELAADGLVEARPGRGTIVAALAHDQSQDRGAAAAAPGYNRQPSWLLGLPPLSQGLGPDPGLLREMAAMGAREGMIHFSAGAPGPDLLPLAALQEALAGALSRLGPAVLGYGPVEGLPVLREAIAERLAARGVAVGPSEVMILSGATQGLALTARALLSPGDEVVVEAPTYVGLLQTLGAAGAQVIGVPVDSRGMCVELLAPILARRRIRLIVVQPTLQNPTNSTLAPERRERLLALARRHGVPILEDDAYGELWRDESGPPPLKAMDRHDMVMHLGSFSKTAAPGLRIGWLAAPPPVLARLVLAKQFADLQSTALSQVALAEFLRSGGYLRHLATVRPAYAQRRGALLRGLRAAPGLQVSPGADGGFYCWCRLPAGRLARLVAAAAARAGVTVLAGEAFYPSTAVGAQEGRDYLRLSCAYHTPALIAEGVRRLLPLLIDEPDARAAGTIGASDLRPVI